MNRDALINFIPKPSNRDVIVYDTSLKDLIDVDVFQEYNDLFPVFKEKYEQYIKYKNDIESYEKEINKIYLFKSDWSEEDYLYHLQNEKKTFSNLYYPIKKIESNIEVLQKKAKMFNEQIELQIAKENKAIEDRKKNIDKRIEENLEKVVNLKDILATLKIEKEKIKESLKENEEDFNILQGIIEDINNGECKCRYCKSKLSNVSENSLFYKRTYKNLEENKKQLEKLLEKKEKNDEQFKKYQKEIKEIQAELKNDINFKPESSNFYRKKSIEVLKLEGKRDAMLKDIEKLEKELKNDSQTKSKRFLDLKDKINKYELSLENLQKIKEMKKDLQQKKTLYTQLKEEVLDMKSKMDQYKTFLTIFFKIYEQKAAEFCGKDIKFKIFDFEGYTLIEKFEIYYKTIEFKNLTPQSKETVKKIWEEKFLFYD